MSEQFVNRYVVVLGHCGLGGTAYEIHATSDDLLVLAKRLEEQLGRVREGNHWLQEAMTRQDIAWRGDIPFPVLSEYVTLSELRTDRMCIRFCIDNSLHEHHVMKSEAVTAHSVGLGVAKFLWFVVFPILGVVACVSAFVKWVGE